MAKNKEEKVNAINSIKDVTEENVMEQIRNANVFSKEVVEKAKENREKEEAERQAREFGRIADKSSYCNLRLKLQAKYNKKAFEAINKASKESLALVDEVAEGKLTALEYDEKLNKIIEEGEKAIDAAGKEYSKAKQELRNAFPNSWSYQWDNPYQRLNRAMERNS